MPRDRRDGWRRLVALLLAAMMIAASCGSDDDEAIDTSSSTSATETTQSPAEDSDEAESEGAEESGAEEEDISEPVAYDEAFMAMFEAARPDGDLRAAAESRCGYRTDLVISRASQLGEQGELLPLTRGEITGGGFGYEGLPSSALDLLTGPLYLYRLPAGLDAYEVSQVVNDVRPILLAGFVPHWGYAPGEQATEVAEDAQALADLFREDVSTEVPAAESDSVVVGVIDTGLVVPSDGFPWPDERVVTATSLLNPPPTSSDVDREPDGFDATYRGHGTFVASLILQQEPSSRVVVAAVRNSPAELFVNYLPDQTQTHPDDETNQTQTHPDDETKPPTPDEVQMLGAVGRLVEANVDGTPVGYDALNVSMGAYDCVGLTDQGLAIEAAVELWNSKVPNAPIVAAAGNSGQEELDVQFLPASLEAVESVVALDASGADLAAYSARQVNDDVQAIGSGLIGFRGDGKLWSWSGTSFATAIVSASVAASPGDAIPDTVDLSTTRVIAQN